MTNHPWKLTGPWYRNNSIGGVEHNRNSAPIFQKYAATDFANRIVKEPQQSLKFIGEDFVNRITLDPNQIITMPLRRHNPEKLKFFLDLHSRYYIVVCSLHCDLAGFPAAKREQVCEAGFVVRRRMLKYPAEASRPLHKVIQQRNELKAQVLKAGKQQKINAETPLSFGELLGLQSQELSNNLKSVQLQKLQEKFQINTSELDLVVDRYQIKNELQRWNLTDLKGVGNWQSVEDSEQSGEEQVYPLYPMIDDPTDSRHSARGHTLWFGVVPTSSADTTSQGDAKFDDKISYQVHCFVRRHKPNCPKKNNQTDCSGELVWSQPTEPYRLASAFDLDGTSHRPINIKMPNLDDLKKQADLGPAGRGVSAKVISPENSTPVFSSKNMDLPELGSQPTRPNEQICFYFSLLFFLVAMFLFRLILPIFMFLFQLWFLLKLKFCIPPSFGLEIDVDLDVDVEFELAFELAVELEIKGPDLEAKFLADPSFKVEFDGVVYTNANKHLLNDLIAKMIAQDSGVSADGGTEGSSMKDAIENDIGSLSLDELAATFIAMKTEFGEVRHPELKGDITTPEQGLVYFEKVIAA